MDRDIVIVGGGPAGSTTALALSHAAPEQACRIVVLERATYPREKPCAGALGGRADALLAEVGTRIAVPGVRVDGVSFRGALGATHAAPGRIGRVIRRTEFDEALARAASARGVRVREGVRVLGVSAGPVVETDGGPIPARVVVGCDGVGSVVRRSMGLGAGRWRARVVEVDTEPLPSDPPRSLLHFDASDPRLTGYAWDFPTTVAGRPLVCRGVYQLRVGGRDEPDVGELLTERLAGLGVDPSRGDRRRYAERGYERPAYLARGSAMLVGEAAGIDPATGEGIAQAIEYGVLAGRFLADELRRAPAGPISVEGWTSVVSRSRLALDLRVRTRVLELFFGPARERLERLLTTSPDLLHVGGQHFGGKPRDRRRSARLAWRALGLVPAALFGPRLLADEPLAAASALRARGD